MTTKAAAQAAKAPKAVVQTYRTFLAAWIIDGPPAALVAWRRRNWRGRLGGRFRRGRRLIPGTVRGGRRSRRRGVDVERELLRIRLFVEALEPQLVGLGLGVGVSHQDEPAQALDDGDVARDVGRPLGGHVSAADGAHLNG